MPALVLLILSVIIAGVFLRWLLLAHALTILFVYLCCKRRWGLLVSVIPLIGALCLTKILSPQGAVSSIGGYSFLVFRMLHFTIDFAWGRIGQFYFLDLATYAFFFPTFWAGPLMRFQDFSAQSRTAALPNAVDIQAGLKRVFLGLAVKFLIANPVHDKVFPILQSPELNDRYVTILSACFGLSAFIYADFSAYSSIAIGLGRILGYKIPENFNRPFLRDTPSAFWKNWHMTLQSFIRDYFFLPLFGNCYSKPKLYFGILSAMVIFCIWHRFTFSFLLLGLYYGAGIIFADIVCPRPKRKTAKIIARLFTLLYFGIGLNLFFFGTGGAIRIFQAFFG